MGPCSGDCTPIDQPVGLSVVEHHHQDGTRAPETGEDVLRRPLPVSTSVRSPVNTAEICAVRAVIAKE